ncbi:MAG: ribonuclease M5 [Thermotaleaceae bacterium]
MIKEVIVVEGRDDAIAVKRAVDAEIIITHGFGITEEIFRRIAFAQERKGVIILTDPDYAGEKIRKQIAARVQGCKHAFVPKEKAIKNGDIGVENASSESIIEALEKAKTEKTSKNNEFSQGDMVKYHLLGSDCAAERRDLLGKLLGIGHANGKQFLNRLNNYGITREEFENAIKKIK